MRSLGCQAVFRLVVASLVLGVLHCGLATLALGSLAG